MVATLLAWLLATFVCWTCGYAFFTSLGSAKKTELPQAGTVCLVGFALVVGVASILSLVRKVDLACFLAFFALSFLFFIYRGAAKHFYQNVSAGFRLPTSFLILFLISSFLVVAMSAWHIVHPDTVEYHAAIINSVKARGLIKGFANENIRYGLQSTWFVGCSLFSFDFAGIHTLTFANSIVLIWFLHVVITSLAHAQQNKNYPQAFIVLVFFALAFLDFNQIRLSSVSAAPDFIAAIYILLALHTFLCSSNAEKPGTIVLFAATAIAFKLSSLPLVPLLIYIPVKQKSFRKLAAVILLTGFILLPFFLRNYFTSGYILFPSTSLSIFKPSWQLAAAAVQGVSQYVTAYARTTSSTDEKTIRKILEMPLNEWLPVWWGLRNIGQKILLVITLATLLAGILRGRKVYEKTRGKTLLVMVIAGFALLSWFMLAPDPRFATAWLVVFDVLILSAISNEISFPWLNARLVVFASHLLSLSLAVYLLYRLIYFFDAYNLLLPYGLR